MRALTALLAAALLAGCTGGADGADGADGREPVPTPSTALPPLPPATDERWRTGVFVALPLDRYVLRGDDARAVLDAVHELAKAHLALARATTSRAKNSAAGQEYLVRTAAVHDLIDRARSTGPHGLSKDNIHAVRKLWVAQGDPITDAIAELKDVVDSADDDDDAADLAGSSDLDDGWDDGMLELGSGKILPEQRMLAESVRARACGPLSTLPKSI